MDDHAGGFVDDGEIFVFVNDVERNIFGLEAWRPALGQLDLDLVVFPQLVRCFCAFRFTSTSPSVDQPLKPRARPAVDLFGEKCVEPYSEVVRSTVNSTVIDLPQAFRGVSDDHV